MELKSLGFKSEMIFASFDGAVEDRGDYTVVRTLTNPNFFWGNLLIFPRPPRKGDYARWTELFRREFTDPAIYHVTLAWESGDTGEVDEFLEHGYDLEAKAVLSARSVHAPPKFLAQMDVRAVESDGDWERIIRLQVDSAGEHLPVHEWEKFYRSQARRYQAMIRAGLGRWYAGFIDGRLAAGLGVFHKDGIGRFQQVCTAPEFRRRGVAGSLVYFAARDALDNRGVTDLVMCADPEYHAITIYESVGFARRELERGVCWWDRHRKNSARL